MKKKTMILIKGKLLFRVLISFFLVLFDWGLWGPLFYLRSVGHKSERTWGRNGDQELCIAWEHSGNSLSGGSSTLFQSEGSYEGWGQWLGHRLTCIKQHKS